MVFHREGITPGDGGRTSLMLPDPLAPEHSYFWRVRAEDGANTGPYSTAASFDVFTPIVIDPPEPVAPAVNALGDAAASDVCASTTSAARDPSARCRTCSSCPTARRS